MNDFAFTLLDAKLVARASGALWWPEKGCLVVSDLHLGKSKRVARQGGALLPPYETQDTLLRLDAEIRATGARRVICLGDSFDDLPASREMSDAHRHWLVRLQAGRQWIWIEGNHDPGPIALPGTHRAEVRIDGLVLRHIAQPGSTGEISGHYHPKKTVVAGGRPITRRCFLLDEHRVILPAFGSYTGGLATRQSVLANLMQPDALAIMTGEVAVPVPMAGHR